MRRIVTVSLLLGLVGVTCILVAFSVFKVSGFFAQPGASGYVLRVIGILIAYAVAAIWAGTRSGKDWNPILQTALWFGFATGIIEIVTVAVENGFLLAQQSKFFQMAGILGVFAIWGVAGFRASWCLKSIKAGLLTSIGSAMVCMLIGVFGGIVIELFVVSANPDAVATWDEFKRSNWSDPIAFQVANTLDSAFAHLLLAPIVAAMFGAIGSTLARAFRGAPNASGAQGR